MMRMHKSIARQGKACTMDSGFCVSVGIVRLFERLGVYAQSLIKKRGRFWPKSVPGDQIDEHFRMIFCRISGVDGSACERMNCRIERSS